MKSRNTYFYRDELIPVLSVGEEVICAGFCTLGCVVLKWFGYGVCFTFTCEFCLLSTQSTQFILQRLPLIALGKESSHPR